MIDPETLQAYIDTDYQVWSSPVGPFSIRINELHPLLDDMLQSTDAASWAYITASNPFSRLLSAEENLDRHMQLLHQVTQAGYNFYEGAGQGQGDWPPEVSILIIGISNEEATRLAKAFEQNAYVFGYSGSPAELVIVE